MDGWIKLHRRMKEHWIWKSDRRFQWWIDILITVNHDDAKVLIGNKLIECKRGQSIRSLESWAKDWNVTKKTVKDFFRLLENDSMISTESLQITTRLTVCNYGEYQDGVNDQETDSKRNGNGQETDTTHKQEGIKNDKERKEKNVVDFDFHFSSNKFKEAWHQLISMPKWKKKPSVSLQKSLDKLKKYDEQFALDLINSAIEGNYQGLVFQDTDIYYEKWKMKQPKKQEVELDPRFQIL